jgi:CspA family cold shock protein
MMPQGTIKTWFQDKGFGFIKPEAGGADVFFHESALREGDEVAPGKAVTYEVGTDKRTGKTKAIEVDVD